MAKRELAVISDCRNTGFDTIFIGGGNPGILGYDGISEILTLVHARSSHECTVEINPENLCYGLEKLCDAGMTRLSMGVQSFDERFLAVLGRKAGLDSIKHACAVASRVRHSHAISINCDLICCIPGQTSYDALRDIDALVAAIQPEHISLYGLSIEEGTPLMGRIAAGKLAMPSNEEQADMLFACWERLACLGYVQYEISNFALSGNECRHNRHYWNLDAYVGVGPSAASTLFSPSGPVRWNCRAEVESYVLGDPFESYDSEVLDTRQWMTERLITELRTVQGVDELRFSRDFGASVSSLLGKNLGGFLSRWPDCTAIDQNRFSLTRKGWMLMDSLLVDLVVAIGL